MPKYEAWLPVHMDRHYVLETAEPITDPAELRRRLVEEGEPAGCLCHQCSNHLQESGDADVEAQLQGEWEVREVEG